MIELILLLVFVLTVFIIPFYFAYRDHKKTMKKLNDIRIKVVEINAFVDDIIENLNNDRKN